MIRLEGVRKSYGGALVLDEITATMARGRTTAIIGPSASGKSTLLELIIGIQRPDGGAITIDGEPLTPQSSFRLRRRMGYVIQDGGLFPHLTARRNIELMAREVGWSPEQRRQRLEQLSELTSFSASALDRFAAELSGGQRQRVSLMRALMLDPEILLMDEPLGALDPLIRAELQDELKSIFRDLGKTVVFVTHDLFEAAHLGETIMLLHHGRIIQQGRFLDLLSKPADPFVSRFVQAQLQRFAVIGEQAMASGL